MTLPIVYGDDIPLLDHRVAFKVIAQRSFNNPYSYLFIVPLGLLVLAIVVVIVRRKGRRHNDACLLPSRQRRCRQHQQQVSAPLNEYLPRYEREESAPPPAYVKSQV